MFTGSGLVPAARRDPDPIHGRAPALNTSSLVRRLRYVVIASVVAVAACSPSGAPPEAPTFATEWRDFQGMWTAVGSRHAIRLGDDQRASIANFEGTALLSGVSRPAVRFRAEAIVLNDSVSGMVGRAVWTDDRGDQA